MPRSAWLRTIRDRLQTLWGHRRTAARRGPPRARPRLEALEDRTVLSASLVADLNQLPVDSNPHNLVNLDGTLYFTANDATHGSQLWKSDGTAAGTAMVTDINPTAGAGFDPEGLTVVGHTLYFSANDGTHGVELWKSDGTADGTVMVTDPGAGISSPGLLTNVNGTLYFATNTATGQNSRLYKSDGTADGTVEIAGDYPGQIRSLTAAGDELYFFTGDPNGINPSATLWKTDGMTAQQLTTVTQPGLVAAADNALFYNYILPGVGYRFTRTDSTGSVNLGSYRVYAGVSFHGSFYFSDGLTNALWKSDGTSAGTTRVANFPAVAPLSIVTFADAMYFTANDGTGVALWKSDGTAAGTVRVTGTSAGISSPVPGRLVAADGELYFLDVSTTHGYSLWKSDGTAAGTARVADNVAPFSIYNSVSPFTAVGGSVFFVPDNVTRDFIGRTTDYRQLWKSDGTAAGTGLVKVVNTATASASPHGLFNFNGALYFTANDGVHGDQLYTTDGTAAGTVRLTSVPGGTEPHDLVSFNGKLYFSADAGEGLGELLWQSVGTPVTRATPLLAVPGGQYLTVFNGAIYYRGFQQGHGYQLFKSDGINFLGTVRVTDINTRSFSGFDISDITVFNNALYFSATDGVHGYQLWKSDGTAAGTVMLTNVTSVSGIYPQHLTVVNGKLYFEALVNNSAQLWTSDGTAAGTTAVASLASIPQDVVRDIIGIGDALYFTIPESTGLRLWKSDGTASGTVSLGTFGSFSLGIFASFLYPVNYNDTLFFMGYDPTNGFQLWKSDGTAAGTVRITSVNPSPTGGLGSGPLIVADGQLLFAGNDGVHGRELWASDGTAAGTQMVADINPGAANSNPINFTVVNGVVYFTADDGAHGVELWKVGTVTSGLRVTTDAASVSGVPVAVTVQALNDFGGINPGYTGTVHFASNDPNAVLPADYTFTAADGGTHTFAAVLYTVGTDTLTATDDTDDLTGTENVLVTPSSFVVSGFPSAVTAGDTDGLTVTAYDALGNVATGYTGTVHLSSTDPAAVFTDADGTPLPGNNYTFTAADAGTHAFRATLVRAGLRSITVTDTQGGVAGTQDGIQVAPGAVAGFFVIVPLHNQVLSGTPTPVVISAVDAYGNPGAAVTGRTIQLSSSDGSATFANRDGGPLAGGNQYTFAAADNGTAVFYVTFRTRGTQSLTVTDTLDPTLTGTEDDVNVV